MHIRNIYQQLILAFRESNRHSNHITNYEGYFALNEGYQTAVFYIMCQSIV